RRSDSRRATSPRMNPTAPPSAFTAAAPAASSPVNDTNARAERRSGERSTRVTVTSPAAWTRGSFTSRDTSSEISARSAAASRAVRSPLTGPRSVRRSFFGLPVRPLVLAQRLALAVLDDVLLLVDDLGDREAVDEVHDLRDHLLHEALVVGDDGEAEDGLLPVVLAADLGDRHVELQARAVLDAAEDHPFVLERLAFGGEEREPADAYNHYKVAASSTIS